MSFSTNIYQNKKKLQWALYFGYAWFDTRKIKTAATHVVVSEALTRNKNTENTIHFGKYQQFKNEELSLSVLLFSLIRIQTKK